jgi:2,4-dienoyl-CoA reductase-like NADH-dependent reductase (Old Yellow Enzyme family)
MALLPVYNLAHAGRKASHTEPWNGGKQIQPDEENGWQAVAPSAIAFSRSETAPLELDKAGIAKVIADFKAATSTCIAAGFKVIELHGAHGYLINEFFRRIVIHVPMNMVASFENRIRFLLEVDRCRKRGLACRISAVCTFICYRMDRRRVDNRRFYRVSKNIKRIKALT